MKTNKYDIAIIGAGISGLCLAHQAKKKYKNIKIAVIEKESTSGFHTSGRNSGVLHAGIYYKENSLKASVCINGAKRLKKWIEDHNIEINNCGKVIVAQNKKVENQLDILMDRADANHVVTELLSKKQLHRLFPQINPNACGGIWSPNTAVVNPKRVISALTQQLKETGIEFYFGAAINKFLPDESSILLEDDQKLEYNYMFNCSGIHAEEIAKVYDVGNEYKVIPFKGLYWEIKDPSKLNISTNIYPVPDLNVPFLGVHFTPSADAGKKTYIGPTATLAFGKENYNDIQGFDFKTSLDSIKILTMQYIKNKNNIRRYFHEQSTLMLEKQFLYSAKSLIPSIEKEDIIRSDKKGIRPQLFNIEKEKLEDDFICLNNMNSTHVLNAISPAFTASFELADLIIKQSNLK